MSFLTLSAQTYPNTALGYRNLASINADLGVNNAALGIFALSNLVTGVENVAIGLEALAVGTGASFNVAIGSVALRSANTNNNVAIGYNALSLSSYTGSKNTAIGQQSGSSMTSGSSNVIIGSFTGVGGSLDIRTLSNYIVLSDGDGNPRLWIDNTGAANIPGGIVWSGGTANGVLYLNASNVVSSGSALTFDGTTFSAPRFRIPTGGFIVDSQSNVTFNPSAGGSLSITSNGSFTNGNILYNALAASGIHAWQINSGEAMRLNSTGLGIGTSNPTGRLHVAFGTAAAAQAVTLQTTNTANGNGAIRWQNNLGTNQAFIGSFFNTGDTGNLEFGNGSTTNLQLSSTGNLGLGVTPSSQFTSYRAINLGFGTNNYFAISGNGNATCEGNLTWNARSTAVETFAYLFTGDNATRYRQQYDFKWYLAPAGTAGNAISFTQAMMLDTSGNLGLGVTPSAWSTGVAIQTRGAGIWDNGTNNTYYAQNAFFNGTNWVYRNSFAASSYLQTNGTHVWYSAGVGVANNGFSFLQQMHLSASGNLGIGGVTPPSMSGVSGLVGNYLNLVGGIGFYASGNAYYDTAWKYYGTGTAGLYEIIGAQHTWKNISVSGSAGNPISFTQAMTLFSSGALHIGGASDPGAGRVKLTGNQATGVYIDVENTNAGAAAQAGFRATSTGGTATFAADSTAGGDVGILRTDVTLSGGLYLDTFASAPIVFRTNGTNERGRFDGVGNFIVNTAAIATTATDGFIYVPSCAGPPTGVPTTYTGRIPMVVDSTNNHVYFYIGGNWRYANTI